VSLKIVSRDGEIVSENYPRTSGGYGFSVRVGSYGMRYRFTWSAIYSPNVDGSLMFPHF
jgi:hypothetical protein